MTSKHLDASITTINKILGRPVKAYAHDRTGDFVAQVGHIFATHNAYYGYSIAEMASTGGAEHTLHNGASLREAKAWAYGVLFILNNPKIASAIL